MSASCISRVRFDVMTTTGRLVSRIRADLRYRDLEVGEHLQQVALELLVGPVQLVDEEHHGAFAPIERLQEGTLDEELLAEQLALRRCLIDVAGRLQQPDVQQLPRVVPLVNGLAYVQPLVALQPDEARAQRRRQHLGDLRLADARLAFEEERPLQRQREVDRHRQRAVGDVQLAAQRLLQFVDGRGRGTGARFVQVGLLRDGVLS